MIRVGITGGETPTAGNLIRILINHPDVELALVESPSEEGALLFQRHKGLAGETYMQFCGRGNLEDIDLLFLCNNIDGDSERYLASHVIPEGVKIIDLSPDFRINPSESTPENAPVWVYALPELNRKPLVRGAMRAAIPGSLASVMLLSLLPMAKNLLLNSEIHVSCVTPHGEDAEGEATVLLEHEEIEETAAALRTLQQSFNAPIRLTATAGGWNRGISATIYFNTPIAEDEIKDIYDTFYEDHGFTFLSESFPGLDEVRGTNKCMIHIEKSGDQLVISTVVDDTLKGGAAGAVHVMNLLYGLQERVGLMLTAAGV